MLHTNQSRGDVRRAIVDALVDLDRPASTHDLAYYIFDRSLIDGTHGGVFLAVEDEAQSMVADQLHRDGHIIEDAAVVRVFEPYDPLAAIAVLAAD